MKFPPFDFDIIIKISKDGDTCFGPGICDLLKYVQQAGSLRAAARKMKMSHRVAVERIKNSELILGYPLLIRQTGGVGGGHSHLTENACLLVEAYMNWEKEINKLSRKYVNKHFMEIEKEN